MPRSTRCKSIPIEKLGNLLAQHLVLALDLGRRTCVDLTKQRDEVPLLDIHVREEALLEGRPCLGEEPWFSCAEGLEQGIELLLEATMLLEKDRTWAWVGQIGRCHGWKLDA